MPVFITTGYESQEGYDRTRSAIRDAGRHPAPIAAGCTLR